MGKEKCCPDCGSWIEAADVVCPYCEHIQIDADEVIKLQRENERLKEGGLNYTEKQRQELLNLRQAYREQSKEVERLRAALGAADRVINDSKPLLYNKAFTLRWQKYEKEYQKLKNQSNE